MLTGKFFFIFNAHKKRKNKILTQFPVFYLLDWMNYVSVCVCVCVCVCVMAG